MTKEISYIIENRKFKSTWSESIGLAVWLLMIFAGTIVGLSFAISGGNFFERLFGLLAIIILLYLAFNAYRKFKLLNTFVTVETGLNQRDNYNNASEIIKKILPTKTEYDNHNYCISIKIKDYLLLFGKIATRQNFPVWITIVALDNVLLINERPEQPEFIFWTRTSIKELIKIFEDQNRASR